MSHRTIQLTPDWLEVLLPEFEKPYFNALRAQLADEKQRGIVIYPPSNDIFRAFNSTPFQHIKVVILGQDPYHGVGQAHGLSFSVPNGVSVPPSLRNIFKEIKADIGSDRTQTNLSDWASQGVLLLNACLTVRANQPASHQGIGWEQFTDRVIALCSARLAHVVFILWGKFAHGKKPLIDLSKHCVIESAHPSPFSADRGFFGSKPFSQANNFLMEHGLGPIRWA